MPGNELLAEERIIPDYSQVAFCASGWRGYPDFDDVDNVDFIADESSINVFTFADDQADPIDRTVTVRVYRGVDSAGLGNLIFDAPLNFPEPELTFGSILSHSDDHQHVRLLRSGVILIRVLTGESQPDNGVDQINVLIDDN